MGSDSKYFEAAEDEVLSAKIIEFAREYQANDFPNVARENCPSEELLKVADSGTLPNANLREHLLGCSPCFLEFQAARRRSKAILPMASGTVSAATKSSWFSFVLQPLPTTALCLLLCGVLGAVLYYWNTQSNTEIAGQSQQDLLPGNPDQINGNQKAFPGIYEPQTEDTGTVKGSNQNETVKTQPSAKKNIPAANKETNNSKIGSESEPKLLARNMIKLDLAKVAVLRNETSRETIYNFPSEMVTLSVKLLTGSPAGNYEVSLVDESGNPILKSLVKRSDGKNLAVNLDLRNKSGQARLCVAPANEIPDCFAISIGRTE